MVSDLIFSVLPREGKASIEKEQFKVQQVDKEAKIRELSDEEKGLNAEERDAREKHEGQPGAKARAKTTTSEEDDGKDADGHLDIYV
ncbi:hypothetical protein [Neptunicella marina]|uniref:Uncharacterized protein n=1 Tax=Neptunicella marina TaxID=2125989 RepID=A0A8J6IQR7_9ALTE|nr:hypothetical protein [Neptunicella marina]MBC3764684.1 hypothetical protein [Neptunicella marina]